MLLFAKGLYFKKKKKRPIWLHLCALGSAETCNARIRDSTIEKSKPKEMFCIMPVMTVRGLSSDKADFKGQYMCPTYKTAFRGPTFVYKANLKTKSPPARWILGGVALLLEVT